MLISSQETLELVHTGHNKTGEVAITALNFPDNESSTFWIGTEEGNVYQANRYDRAGAKAGLNQFEVHKGHSGPVMGLHFHPSIGPVDFSDLFLTCAVDWTVKLWRAKSIGKPSSQYSNLPPRYSFEEADDYVYDVQWHPTHPALFGTVLGKVRSLEPKRGHGGASRIVASRRFLSHMRALLTDCLSAGPALTLATWRHLPREVVWSVT